MKVGDKLIAINPCVMEDGRDEGLLMLTVGKEYKIVHLDYKCIYITNDLGQRHSFNFNDIKEFFRQPDGSITESRPDDSITESGLLELGFKKGDYLGDENSWVFEGQSYNIVVHDDLSGAYLRLYSLDSIGTSCKTIDDLKQLIKLLTTKE